MALPCGINTLYFEDSFQGEIGILITHRLGGAKNADEIIVISGGRVCEQGKIAFIVTHRLSRIKFCDKIIVMQKGTVLDIGSHEKLLSDCPYYKTLWNSQAEMYTMAPIS